MHKIVTLGGGSGQYALLCGLRDITSFAITAIVSMTDSGGSTGRLRHELGILPPGDILKCVLALAANREPAENILLTRFTSDPKLNGHNAGNMLLTMLSQYTGCFAGGVAALSEILQVNSQILPVSTDKATLVALLNDGRYIYGEQAIDQPKNLTREKIKTVFLVPHHGDKITVYPPVIQAIEQAETIILGPGDLYTSIIANLIVPGIAEALTHTSANILYVMNIMTKFGETHDFTANDFIATLEQFINRPLDGIIYNQQKPNPSLLAKYKQQQVDWVVIDSQNKLWQNYPIYSDDLLDSSHNKVRHHSKKLARLLEKVIKTHE